MSYRTNNCNNRSWTFNFLTWLRPQRFVRFEEAMNPLLSWIVIILLGLVSYLAAWSIVKAQATQDALNEHIKENSPVWMMVNGKWVNWNDLTPNQKKLKVNSEYGRQL